MDLDGELYREAYKALKQWKEDESIDRLLQRRNLSPEQAWKQYIALWELLMKLTPQDRKYQHFEHLRDLDQYYSKIQKLQTWMRSHGETP